MGAGVPPPAPLPSGERGGGGGSAPAVLILTLQKSSAILLNVDNFIQKQGNVMSNFDKYIQYKALGVIYQGGNSLGDLEEMLERGSMVVTDADGNRVESPGLEHVLPVKNLCAKVPAELVDRIDQVIGLIGMNKRDFVELAIREALERADKIIEEEGVYSWLEAHEKEGEQ